MSNAVSNSVETTDAARPRAIYWLASLALAAALLYYSLRGIDWTQIWITLKTAQPLFVLLAAGLMSLNLFLRAIRWRVILQAEGAVSVALAFWATSAGYLGNNLLPARAGEVVRSLMISRRTGMSKTFVLTTALSERIVDAIALISISSVVLLTLRQRPGWLAEASKPFAILGLLGVVAIILIPTLEVFWFRVLTRIPIPEKLRTKVEAVLRQGVQGIRSFHNPSRLARFLVLTAVIWTGDAVISCTLARSIHLTVTLPMAFLLAAGLGLGSALPSTPGYVGIYQFVAVSLLTPFGLSRNDAIAFILLFQALNYVIIFLWGGVGMVQQRKSGAVNP